jgi:alpha-tubulin suppressor-like RCC1 family protein
MGRPVSRGAILVVASLALGGCSTEVASPIPGKFQQVVAGLLHSCGLLTDGTAYCWGYNDYGQLGDGSRTSQVYPQPVAGSVRFTMLTAGGGHTCGLATSGAAYCWGLNLNGQLGDRTHTNHTTPVAVDGGLTFLTLAAGGAYTCGIAADSTAYCWGWNADSQLGVGDSVDQSLPGPVLGGLKFVAVDASSFHTCALTAGGAGYCWGNNDYGQLGTGDRLASPVPVAVTGGFAFVSVVTGYAHTCGVTTDARGYCWGRNQAGQLGVGDSLSGVDQLAPYLVDGGIRWSEISSGAYFTCGVGDAGAAYCWGNNQSGQLGADASTTCLDENQLPYYCANSPLAVGGGLVFSHVRASTQHACGMTADGVAYCWGRDTYGQLGDGRKGDQVYSVQPVKVGGQP